MRNTEFSTGQHRAIRRAEPSTPPVANSKAVGGPSAADGQGVCTLNHRFVLHLSWAVDAAGVQPEKLTAATERDCADWLEVALKSGASTVTVEVLS